MHGKIVLWLCFLLGELVHILKRASAASRSKNYDGNAGRWFARNYAALLVRVVLGAGLFSAWAFGGVAAILGLLKQAGVTIDLPGIPLAGWSALFFGFFVDAMLDWLSAKVPFLRNEIPQVSNNGNGGKPLVGILVVALALSLVPVALAQQPQYALELGGACYASTTPHSAGYLTALIPVDAANKTRSYTTVEMRPVALGQVAYSTRTGFERTLYADSRVSLNAFVQGGVATGASVTAGIFAAGGNVAIPIKRSFALVIGAEALASPAVGGWEPQGRVGFRYTFGQ